MRVIYFHQYFTYPELGGGTRSYEFARRFVEAGHEVHMIASWRGESEHTTWFQTEVEGIKVHWLPVDYTNRMGFLARVRSFASFAFGACRYVARLRGDVVFATSTPLTIAIPGIYAAKQLKVPLVFEVRDLWPEAPRQMGEIKNQFLFWLATRLEFAAYRNSAHIVALSPGMKAGVLASGVPKHRVSMIPNSCDLDLFHPGICGLEQRRKLEVGDRLMLAYFGTMGPANGLDFVLDAAAELKGRGQTGVVFVLHGDGKMRPHLERRKAVEGLDNVIFSGPSDKLTVTRLAAAADVGLTIFKNVPILYTCSPNKMFDTLAAGRPVLTNMPGWLTDTVEQNGCGIGVRPDDPSDFANKVQWLLANRERLPEMGRKARELAERDFSRDVLAGQLLSVLERAVAAKPPVNRE
ncbi:MAG: glycosyltransferase family 4 protein [Opitutaceae bacterium]|nr:glycosyltransferase family 4 protein [Opitutaceae bacterium]